MKKLYFVRHGQSQMNVSGHYAGTTDTPLTEEGKRQAKRAGWKAKRLRIDLIISSPLPRAHETAKIIARVINYPEDKIELNPLLVERSYGALHGQPWAPDLDLDGIADVESSDTILNRAAEVLESLKKIEADNILVVSHGTIGGAIRNHILKGSAFRDDDGIPNAEVSRWI